VAELRSELVEVKSQLAEAKSQLAEARGRLEQVQQIDQDTVSALTSKLQEQQAEIVELKAKLDLNATQAKEREDHLVQRLGELGSLARIQTEVEETRKQQAVAAQQLADMQQLVRSMQDAAKAAAAAPASGPRSYATAVGASGSGARVSQQQSQRAGGPIGFKLTGLSDDDLAHGGRPAVEQLLRVLNTQHVSYCNWRIVRSPARDGRAEKKMVFFEVPGASDVARILEHAGRAELRTELKNRNWWLDPLFSEEEMRNRKALYEAYGAAIREAQQKAKQQRGLWVRWCDNGTKVFLWDTTTRKRVPIAELPPPPPMPSTAGA
jgi:hypothetical protein